MLLGMWRSAIIISCCFCPAFCLDRAAAEVGRGDGIDYFESRVRPILVQRCYGCHSEESGKHKGGLFLDRRSGWEQGGDSGPALVPGDPGRSSLVRAIRYLDEDLQMPPKAKLPAPEIHVLEEWIRLGAPDPRDEALSATVREGGIDYEAARRSWAFRPLAPVGRTIDEHIDAGLAAAGLAPSPPATPRERLHRLFLDLTGLPPTPAELRRFEADPSPTAWAAWIDELLARPGFGETWGRHWLDVARYADSNGGDRNFTYPQAWRYRNYVIDAFNEDRSWYDFVREQIAGDLLGADDPERRRAQVVASTFLALGPKMLTERDKEKLALDVADEQLDTLGRVFLGLTLGCARCHDHKFDPVSQRDYYALAGILRSTQVVLGTRNGCVNVASWVERALPGPDGTPPAGLEAKIARLELAMRLSVEKNFRQKNGAAMALMGLPLAGVIVDDKDAEFVGAWKASTYSRPWVGTGYRHDNREGKGVKHAVYRAGLPESGLYEVRLAYRSGDNRAAAVPVTVRTADGERSFTVDQRRPPSIGGLFEPIGRFAFEKGAEASVTLSNAGTEGYVMADAVQFVPVADLEREAAAIAEATARPGDTNQLFAMSEKQLKKVVADLIDELKGAEVAMAPREASDAGDVHLRVRGVVSRRGERVPRGFLPALPHTAPARIGEGESGRRELAEWMVAPGNALLDRVAANRIWHHLMGRGVVRTVDNFGALGAKPTHPELLDDLAARFRRGGGSVKAMVREIARSEAYQRSSRASDALREGDPGNEWFGRQQRRRLRAEELRDSVLLLAGGLSRERGGATAAKVGVDLDKPLKPEASALRSVYLPVARNNATSSLTVFDMANPDLVAGARSETTVPTQALYLLNSGFMADQAAALAARAEGDDSIRWLYRQTLLREPSEAEHARAKAFVEAAGGDGLAHFAGVLLASTEFLFVE